MLIQLSPVSSRQIAISNEWHDAWDQHQAEFASGFVGDNPNDEWQGVHQQIAAERLAGCDAKPEFEIVPVRDVNGRYVWGMQQL